MGSYGEGQADIHPGTVAFDRRVDKRPYLGKGDAFDRAVAEIAHITRHLLEDLVTSSPPKDREEEAAKARARSEKRFEPRDVDREPAGKFLGSGKRGLAVDRHGDVRGPICYATFKLTG